jgi:hypothetical protein
LSEARFEPEAVIAALNGAGVRYVVVGGLASGAHGVVRATRDVDLVPAPDAENLAALAVFAELEAQALAVEIETGVTAPVSSLAHLRKMKRASGRPRDEVDLQELDELPQRCACLARVLSLA